MTKPLLDRETLERAFDALADRLAGRAVRADVYVFGGAAMILGYGVGRATRDVDAVFEPHGVVIEEAAKVAKALGLPQSWLNEQASVYLSKLEDEQAAPVFDHPHLRVAAASATHLLAMKVLAGRSHDLDDATILIDHVGITSAEDVFALVERLFPDDPLSDRKRLLIEDVFATK